MGGDNLLVGRLGINIAGPGATVVLGRMFCLLVGGTKTQGSFGELSP